MYVPAAVRKCSIARLLEVADVYAVLAYHLFPLNLRDVKDLLAVRSVIEYTVPDLKTATNRFTVQKEASLSASQNVAIAPIEYPNAELAGLCGLRQCWIKRGNAMRSSTPHANTAATKTN